MIKQDNDHEIPNQSFEARVNSNTKNQFLLSLLSSKDADVPVSLLFVFCGIASSII